MRGIGVDMLERTCAVLCDFIFYEIVCRQNSSGATCDVPLLQALPTPQIHSSIKTTHFLHFLLVLSFLF
jgi:hypothetical protein